MATKWPVVQFDKLLAYLGINLKREVMTRLPIEPLVYQPQLPSSCSSSVPAETLGSVGSFKLNAFSRPACCYRSCC